MVYKVESLVDLIINIQIRQFGIVSLLNTSISKTL